MNRPSVNAERLLFRIRELGQIGRDAEGRLTRLAASDAEKRGRDQFVRWLHDAGLEVAVDRIGNIFGIWRPDSVVEDAPLLMGSHIDTVVNAGIYDGCYGVLAGLEVIAAMRRAGIRPHRPVAVAAFTNEEGVRFQPDMMGSLVYAGGLSVDEALATVGTDGKTLGSELARIGYAGKHEPGFLKPAAYLELHVEQGPIMEREGIAIGAVGDLQGISWQSVTIIGEANHAGTTPMAMRRDAGHAAARVITWLRERARQSAGTSLATVGCMTFEPNAINVIPSRATFTLDLRDPDEGRLLSMETALADLLRTVALEEEVDVRTERLARFQPVRFDDELVGHIEAAAAVRGLSCKRMTSGAGHDAQMIARVAPSAMIFVPSQGGISHNPAEHTADSELIAGAEVLLDVACAVIGS